MLLFGQVVNKFYMLIYSVLTYILWHFFFLTKSATKLPQKLGVFLKILRFPAERKKPVIIKNYRLYSFLDHLEAICF